jgi:hypothetical protein
VSADLTHQQANLLEQLRDWDDIGEIGIRASDDGIQATTLLIGALGEAERLVTVLTDDDRLRAQITSPSGGWRFAITMSDVSLNTTWPDNGYCRPHLVAEITIPNIELTHVADLVEADDLRRQGF